MRVPCSIARTKQHLCSLQIIAFDNGMKIKIRCKRSSDKTWLKVNQECMGVVRITRINKSYAKVSLCEHTKPSTWYTVRTASIKIRERNDSKSQKNFCHRKAIKKLLSRNTQLKTQVDEAKPKMKLLSTAVAICLALSYLAITAEGAERAEEAEGAEEAIPQCTQDGLLYEAYPDTPDPSHKRIKMINDPKLQGFRVEEPEFFERSEALCDWEGLLKIKLPLPATGGVQKRALGFKFTYVQPPNDLGFPSFHIGDSIYNEAVDDPIPSIIYSAEIFNDVRTLKLHANRELGRPIIPPEANFIDQSHDTMILVGHQFVRADNGDGQMESYQNHLFSLDGSTGAAEVSVGLNRIIKDQSRSGKGLCNVKVYAFTCST